MTSLLSIPDAVILFAAAVVAGTLNSVAGGGSFISFPTLLFTGVPPIEANATNTVALWPGVVASVGAYRREFAAQLRAVVLLGSVSLVGGLLGALLLLKTPETTFLKVLPWLLLFATLLFTFGRTLTRRVKLALGPTRTPHWFPLVGVCFIQLAIAVYGGFFGGGIGIMMLAGLALLGMENIHAMNALKTLLGSLINGIAVIAFIAAGVVAWPQAILMIAGAILGGYGGAWYAQKIDPRLVRGAVIITGALMTAYFFWRT